MSECQKASKSRRLGAQRQDFKQLGCTKLSVNYTHKNPTGGSKSATKKRKP